MANLLAMSRAPTNPSSPLKVALIGGSGLGETFRAEDARMLKPQTPFGRPSSPILEVELEGVPVLLLSRHGHGHLLNPSQVPYRANIFALKELGVTHVLASGAVGSLREKYEPGDVVIPDQLIDKTLGRVGTFFENSAVHVEQAEPFCPILRGILREAATQIDGLRAHGGGCYVCMEGPAFSTRAESKMHRLWGGDMIGMTLMPEAKLAKEAELPYAAVCLVTDYDSWRTPSTHDPFALLSEITANLKQATANATSLLRRAIRMTSDRHDELAKCPARDALRLSIWSDKRLIDPGEVTRLRPLWGRYFEVSAESPDQ